MLHLLFPGVPLEVSVLINQPTISSTSQTPLHLRMVRIFSRFSRSLYESARMRIPLSHMSSYSGGAPNYNIFASPISSVNPVSVGSTSHISAMPVLQQKPAVQSTASPLDDFEFVSNTGAPVQDVGPISGKEACWTFDHRVVTTLIASSILNV